MLYKLETRNEKERNTCVHTVTILLGINTYFIQFGPKTSKKAKINYDSLQF